MRVKKPITSQGLRVINLMKTGLSNKKIAEEMCICEKTVKHHCHAIYKTLGLHSDRELFALILRLNPKSHEQLIQREDIEGYFNLAIGLHSILK